MTESVIDPEIKDDHHQQGTTTEDPTPTETTGIVVVTSAEEDDDDDGGGVEKLKETDFELSKEKKKKKVSVDNKLKANVVVVVVEEEEEEEEEEETETPQTCVVIDVKCCSSNIVGNKLQGENCDVVEKVCRICHLSVEYSPPSSDNSDMIQLGCGCKEELGIAHRHCAETWFKLKGNRCCEICGEAAKNITGMWDDRFMEDWNDRRSVGSNSLDRRWGFWRGQPFCNFLMACLVMAFVLPWFFRVNMF